MTARATRRAFYDADVLVIGAGPAGLSAALRVRWVKGYHALPSSVVVFDPGAPGGLLRWGGCVLTGPSWAFAGDELNSRLLQDLEALRIPVVRERVVAIEALGDGFRLMLDSGATWTGRAVILATGFRAVGEEGEHYLRGVRVTFKGYDYFPSLVSAAAREAGGQGLLVVGHERTAAMAAVLEAHGAGAGGLSFLLEDPRGPIPPQLGSLGTVYLGRLVDLEIDAGGSVRGAWFEQEQDDRAGGTSSAPTTLPRDRPRCLIPCGAILLDYNAFELRPVLEVGGLLPILDDRGFVQVDAWMNTSQPGIFAAGDITGRYAATLVALGDGVTAGFSAYRYVFGRKFDLEPRLFAYRPVDALLSAEPRDLPEIPDDAVPVVLGDPAQVAAIGPVGQAIDDQIDAGSLRTRFGRQDVDDALLCLMERKDITVHRRALVPLESVSHPGPEMIDPLPGRCS